MRNISSWVWITMVAVFMLGSGLVGIFGLPSLGRAWSAMEQRFVADAAPAVAAPAVIEMPQSRPTVDAPVAVIEEDPAPVATPEIAETETIAEAVAVAATATEAEPSTRKSVTTDVATVPATDKKTDDPRAAMPATAAPAEAAPKQVTKSVTNEPKGVRLPQVVVTAPRPTAAPAASPKHNGIRVTLRPEVKVAGDRVMLSDVATVSAPKGTHLPDITTIEVGKLGANALRTSLITRPILRQALLREGVDMQHVLFAGPTATRVVPLRNVVKSAVMMRAAQSFLNGELAAQGWKKTDIQIRPVQDVPDLVVPDGKVGIEASRMDSRRPVGMVMVNLDVRVNDQTVKSVRTSFQVQVSGKALVVRRLVEKGALIAASDVELARRDVSTLPDAVVTDASLVVGKMALWTLRPGAVITEGMTGLQPVVTRNTDVTVHYRGEKVTMTMAGRALKDGQKGDTIPVRNTDTGKVVEAVVIDKNNVDVSGDPNSVPSVVNQDIVPAGVTVYTKNSGIAKVPPSANFSEQNLPPRTPQVQTPQGLPGPNYAKNPAPATPQMQIQAAARDAKQAAPMFDLRTKAMPLR